jgi:histidinol phosphatase-like enzyme (inositol monophosphatase family)
MTSPSSSPLADRFAFAQAIAKEAGDLTLTHYRKRGLAVDTKRDGSPVTIADRSAEELLRKLVASRFPTDAISGEEFGDTPGTAPASGFRWVFDPIDGTKSFVSGVPLYGTMVACLHHEDPVIGVINMPALGEVVAAAKGLGCTLARTGHPTEPARVSGVRDLKEAIFVYTAPEVYTQAGKWPLFERMSHATRLSRGWSDCYGCVLVATGRADIWVEPTVALWDVAAAVPIIEEAGGRYTDLSGRRDATTGSCIATNGHLHDAAMKIVRGE